MKSSTRQIYDFLQKRGLDSLNALLDRGCLNCQQKSQQRICSSCFAALKKVPFRCRRCGLSLPSPSDSQCCLSCLQKGFAFDNLTYLGDYCPPLSDWIVDAKIAKKTAAIEALLCIQQNFLSQNSKVDYRGYHLLAMPTPKLRLMQRGFNLPRLLAKQWAKHYALPLLPSSAVTLPWYRHKQAQLNKRQRQHNHTNYHIANCLPEKILLIDDIITTGETLNGLAKALKNRGVREITVWVLARNQIKA